MISSRLLPTAVVVSLAVGVMAGPAQGTSPKNNAASKRTAHKASKLIRVLRAPKSRRDVVRPMKSKRRLRAAYAALDSRLVYASGALKIYLVPVDGQLCLWAQDPGNGYGASGCQPVDVALSADRPLLLALVRESDVVTTVLMVDGSSQARRVAGNGSRSGVDISNNVAVDDSAGGGSLEWTTPGGSIASLPLLSPFGHSN